jgi:hypothetical protein
MLSPGLDALHFRCSLFWGIGVKVRAAVAILMTLVIAAPSRPAIAACDTEEALFVREPTVSNAFGERNRIYTRDRILDEDCSADAESHSTAHVRSRDNTKFAEVGWWVHWTAGGFHGWHAFWEGKVGSTFYGGLLSGGAYTGPAFACCGWSRFKITQSPAGDPFSTVWKFWWDYNDDGTYDQLGPSAGQNLQFNSGIPLGETARTPGPTTGAFDHHKDLLWAPWSGGTGWLSWSNNTVFSDSMGNYHHVKYADDEYQVEHD